MHTCVKKGASCTRPCCYGCTTQDDRSCGHLMCFWCCQVIHIIKKHLSLKTCELVTRHGVALRSAHLGRALLCGILVESMLVLFSVYDHTPPRLLHCARHAATVKLCHSCSSPNDFMWYVCTLSFYNLCCAALARVITCHHMVSENMHTTHGTLIK
jgi:hypothetical protein